MPVTMQLGPVCHDFGVTGHGNPEFGLAIVGIAPGLQEMKTKLPFQGATGKLVNAILRGVGWSREKTYCTNVCCWRPTENNRDRDPSKMEMKECVDRLDSELTAVQPRLILTLGNVVAPLFTGRELKKVRGAAIWVDDEGGPGHYVLSTYHPAAVLRDKTTDIVMNAIIRDFAKINDILGMRKGGAEPFDFYIVTDPKEAQQVLDALPRNTPVSLDVETSKKDEDGIDVFNDQLICLSISTGNKTWWMPASIVNLLNWPINVRWTFQNGPFDVQAIARWSDGKIWLPIHEDTMFQSYSLCEIPGFHGLKNNAREYLAAPFYEEEIDQYKKKDIGEAPLEITQLYNGNDATYTQRLQPFFLKKQVEDDVRSVYENIMIPAANVMADMQYHGVTVHRENFNKLSDEWIPRRTIARAQLAATANDYGWPGTINLNSPKQLSKFLYEVLGLPGGPSTAKEVIEELQKEHDHPFLRSMTDFRQLDFMVNGHIIGIQDDIKYDGKVHASQLQHSTRTGRTSIRRPPLQTIPTERVLGTDYGRIRFIYTVDDPDEEVIVEADSSQAEVWGAYGYSKDKMLLDDLLSGDYHGRVTQAAFHVLKSELEAAVWKYLRGEAKKITFGVMYGEEAQGLSRNMKCSLEEAKDYLLAFFNRYSSFLEYAERIKWEALHNGEIRSITGRKRRFPLITSSEEAGRVQRQAVNMPIQAFASDNVLMAMIELHPLLKALGGRILFMVHDSLVMVIKKRHLQESIHLIRQAMERPRFFDDFPGIPCEIKYGPTWGEAHIIEDEAA